MSNEKQRWPGLIFTTGAEGFFRCFSYTMFVLAGFALAKHESVIAMFGAFTLGHFSICTAEVIDRMRREEPSALHEQGK